MSLRSIKLKFIESRITQAIATSVSESRTEPITKPAIVHCPKLSSLLWGLPRWTALAAAR